MVNHENGMVTITLSANRNAENQSNSAPDRYKTINHENGMVTITLSANQRGESKQAPDRYKTINHETGWSQMHSKQVNAVNQSRA